MQSSEHSVFVYDGGCGITGFAVLKDVLLPANPYNVEHRFLFIEEIGVDFQYRREGIGSKLLNYVKAYAKQHNYPRIKLDIWSFNAIAEEFYLSQGFETYCKFMEIIL